MKWLETIKGLFARVFRKEVIREDANLQIHGLDEVVVSSPANTTLVYDGPDWQVDPFEQRRAREALNLEKIRSIEDREEKVLTILTEAAVNGLVRMHQSTIREIGGIDPVKKLTPTLQALERKGRIKLVEKSQGNGPNTYQILGPEHWRELPPRPPQVPPDNSRELLERALEREERVLRILIQNADQEGISKIGHRTIRERAEFSDRLKMTPVIESLVRKGKIEVLNKGGGCTPSTYKILVPFEYNPEPPPPEKIKGPTAGPPPVRRREVASTDFVPFQEPQPATVATRLRQARARRQSQTGVITLQEPSTRLKMVDPEIRRMIDQAVAEGRVKRCPTATYSNSMWEAGFAKSTYGRD